MFKIWSLKDGVVIHTFEGHTAEVSSVCWALDGQTIASCSSDGTVRLWDVDTAMCRYVLYAGEPVHLVAISSQSDVVVGTGRDGKFKIWNMRNGSLTPWLGGQDGDDPIPAISMHIPHTTLPELQGRLLTSGTDKTIRLWGGLPQSLRCSREWSGHKVSLSP